MEGYNVAPLENGWGVDAIVDQSGNLHLYVKNSDGTPLIMRSHPNERTKDEDEEIFILITTKAIEDGRPIEK